MKIRDLIYHGYIKMDYRVLLNEWQREFSARKQKVNMFSSESIESLSELGLVLGRVRKRLIGEGFIIRDGKIFKPDSAKTNENN